jgi:hypothetical protein
VTDVRLLISGPTMNGVKAELEEHKRAHDVTRLSVEFCASLSSSHRRPWLQVRTAETAATPSSEPTG